MIARNLFWNQGAPPSVGDFLKVKDATTGELEAGTPILRASGTLQAYTTPASSIDAAPPADLVISASGTGTPTTGTCTLTVNGSAYNFTLDSYDHLDGTTWIDNASVVDDYSLITALYNALNSAGTGLSMVNGGTNMAITSTSAGSGYSTLFTTSIAPLSSLGGGTGTDASSSPASGGVQSIVLAPSVPGKNIKIIAAWYDGAVSASVALFSSASQISTAASASALGSFVPDAGNMAGWLDGYAGGELTVQFTTDPPADGSTCKIGVIFEQH